MLSQAQLDRLDPPTRMAVRSMVAKLMEQSQLIGFKQALIDKLTHEMAVLKRLKFAAKTEAYSA